MDSPSQDSPSDGSLEATPTPQSSSSTSLTHLSTKRKASTGSQNQNSNDGNNDNSEDGSGSESNNNQNGDNNNNNDNNANDNNGSNDNNNGGGNNNNQNNNQKQNQSQNNNQNQNNNNNQGNKNNSNKNNNNNNNNNNGKNNGQANANKNNNANRNGANQSANNKQVKSPPAPPGKSASSNQTPRALGPPPPKSSDSSSSDGLPTSTIIVIAAVAAGVGLLLLMAVIICCLCRRRRKESKVDQMQYYNNPTKASTEFYVNAAHQRRNSYNEMNNLPPPPSHTLQNGGWHTPPPPPGAVSSDMSSNFSGPHGPVLPPPHPSVALGFNQSTFTYEELSAATNGFSQANLLGQGGFGFVHKGTLPNGKEVAVKSLKSGSGQGEREFQAEVEIISRVHHRHLVSLVGYCIAGVQRMLVYEFLPNNTLEYHLHGKGHAIMDWPARQRIALGMAKGLAYLHEDCHPKIIHRDIKTANILLDENHEAKVADFGLAKLSNDNYTHVSTRIMGTFGYLAPEYASSGKLTEKSDVFSFGVMLLELITGKRPVDPSNPMEDSLVDWARPLLTESLEHGNFNELADPSMERNYDSHEMQRMVACAAASIRHSAKRRPKMSQIVRALEGDSSLEDLNDGVKPSSAFSSNHTSSDYENASYNDDMKKFRKVALDSGNMSSEHNATGEYGVNSSSEFDGHGQNPPPKIPQPKKPNLPKF